MYIRFLPLLFLTQTCFAFDLSDVDTFLQTDRFETAFQEHTQTVIETKSCILSICDSAYQTKFIIQSVLPDQAVILGEKMDGTQISQQTVTKSDWLDLKQNRVRFKIRDLESAGYQVSIADVEISSMTISVNGQAQKLPTRIVKLEGVNPLGMKATTTVEVAAGLGGMGQLVREDKSGDTFTVLQIQSSALPLN